MKAQLKCFISYNRKDNDSNTVRSFINHLKKFSNDKIEFLIDEDLNAGGDLSKFMKLINAEFNLQMQLNSD